MATILNTTLTASGTAVIGSGNFKPAKDWIAAIFQLNLVSAATAGGDKLDVAIQHSVDSGQNWTDFITFTQILGTDSPTIEQKTWTLALDGAVGHDWRVNWVVTDVSDPQFAVQLLVDITPKGRVEPAALVKYDNVASGLTAGSMQAAIDEVVTTADALDATVAGLTGSDIAATPPGAMIGTDVQALINELDGRVTALEP